jgi:hypothetical protein
MSKWNWHYKNQILLQLSYGHLGRAWNSLKWTVIGTALTYVMQNISSYLNSYYSSNTTAIIYIPKEFFQPENVFTFVLELSNYLLSFSTSSVSIEINRITSFSPYNSIFGSQSFIYSRFQSIFLSVSATIPKCSFNSSLNVSIQYEWKVFDGMKYLPEIQSISNDPSFFVLPPFVHSYKIQAMASFQTPGFFLMKKSSCSVLIQIPPSTVVAIISGGTNQSAFYD